MAVANYAASVQGVCLRLTRLDATGKPVQGTTGTLYVTKAFMRVSFTPEYEEGDEVTEKNAAGEVCITYKAPDTLKRATMELAICEPDPEITELLSGGVLLNLPALADLPEPLATNAPTLAGTTVGYASGKVGDAPNPNGVGIEVWSLAIRDGARDNDLPYYRWVFPKATLRPSGDRVIENGVLANAFEGFSVGNINFGTGGADDWAWPDATDRPYMYARDNEVPCNIGPNTRGWVNNAQVTTLIDKGEPEGTTGSEIITRIEGLTGPFSTTYPGEIGAASGAAAGALDAAGPLGP
jgi:hypothetical protein